MLKELSPLHCLPSHISGALSDLDLSIPSETEYDEITSLLNQTVLLGGKRFRPMLLFLMGDIFSLPMSELLPFAKAIEYVHVASLCHDDVIDNASSRRGRPSINIVSSNKKAILSGDYLLAKVIRDMCLQGNMEILRELSFVIQDLSCGEWMQLQTNTLFASAPPSFDWILEIISKKTASMISWSCLVPAILSNSSFESRELCRKFGITLGRIFQLTDDILDFSTSGASEEEALADLKSGTINSVLLEYFRQNPQKWQHWIDGSFSKRYGSSLEDLDRAISTIKGTSEELSLQASQLLLQISKQLTTGSEKEKEKTMDSYHAIELLIHYLPRRKK
ncbi:MAG: polyprenyl synthetase family protein [Oligoflexia bacterium]|nr:polyprenyl synthetase family protein [Oligoflexia bacterium]